MGGSDKIGRYWLGKVCAVYLCRACALHLFMCLLRRVFGMQFIFKDVGQLSTSISSVNESSLESGFGMFYKRMVIVV